MTSRSNERVFQPLPTVVIMHLLRPLYLELVKKVLPVFFLTLIAAKCSFCDWFNDASNRGFWFSVVYEGLLFDG